MAKRFTDTDKWKNRWYRRLSPSAKLAWLFILDACDVAGIWEVDEELLSFHVAGVDFADVQRQLFERDKDQPARIVEIDGGRKWWVRAFVDFQYGELRDDVRPHTRVIAALKRYELWEGYLKGIDTLKTTSEAKKPASRSKAEFVPPAVEDVVAYWKEKAFVGGEGQARYFFVYWTERAWKRKGGVAIRDWRRTAEVWNAKNVAEGGGKGRSNNAGTEGGKRTSSFGSEKESRLR